MRKSKSGMRAEPSGESEHEGRAMGKGQFANMPTEVRMEQYPKFPSQRGHDLDDTMREIDRCNAHAEKQESRYLSNQH
jgi:hypothetical protein